MRRFCAIAATVALLTSFIEAPYFHLHDNPASDHAREHHLGKGLTVHSHISIPQRRDAPSPVVESSAETADGDAIFLAQASARTPLFLLPAFLPLDPSRLDLPEPVQNRVWLPAYHSHDPPFVLSAFPRPPPA